MWRHTEAEDALPDATRELTGRGRKQARAWPTGLIRRLPPDITHSDQSRHPRPATPQHWGVNTKRCRIGARRQRSGRAGRGGWPDAAYPVLVVGHQPTLGQVAMQLLAGQAGDLTVKKGGIWWFQSRERTGQVQVVLRAVAAPDWL